MHRFTASVLALFILFVFAFGFLNVILEDLEVAPFMKEKFKPDTGIKVMHTKNTTRLMGNTDEVGKQVHEMVSPYLPNYNYSENAGVKVIAEQLIGENEQAEHVLILTADEEHLKWTLPALYYAVYYGSPVLFKDELQEKGNALEGKHIIVPVPDDIISDDDLEELTFQRIAGSNPASHAVKIAEYRDENSEFGWGRDYGRRSGYFQFVITTPGDIQNAVAALPLAKTNAAALLYAVDDGGIPAATDTYIWSQRADWFVTPSESSFRHFFIVSDRISYASHARIDFSVEKSEYASYGAVALGPMEGIAIVFFAFGFCGALLVLVHSIYFLTEAGLIMKMAWVLGCTLLPVLGPILYFMAYRRPTFKEGKMIRWLRPNSIQTASATIMGFGYGAPIMIAVAYIFAYFGFPIFFPEWFGEYTFWIGAGMPFMMIMMYVLAVLIAWPLVQYPMKKMMMDMKKSMLLWMSFKVTAISMFFVSLGMMTVNWWMMMWHINMMPQEDDILWFFSIFLASFVGFLIAWPFNWILLKRNLKPGNV